MRLNNLQDILERDFGKLNIDQQPLASCIAGGLNPAFALRPYQQACFRYFQTYWEHPFPEKEAQPHLLFHMATGSGKTLIMAGLMLYLYTKGYRDFLFFVDSANIIEKTKDNFLNAVSHKYLFRDPLQIDGRQVHILPADNFQGAADGNIRLCLTTIQGLHAALNEPRENGLTYDDFNLRKVALISDEAHHINVATKRQRKLPAGQGDLAFTDGDFSDDWETTVMRILKSRPDNVLLEFTATEDFNNAAIAAKYKNKVLFDYSLKLFREDGFSKDIQVVQSDAAPIDRALQSLLLSQYKRKLFASVRQDIKPVILFKSKTIKDNKAFYDAFVETVRRLDAETLVRLRAKAEADVAEVFTYLDAQGISLENFALELKEDFSEDKLLLVDGNSISPEKQKALNRLESPESEYRAVFAVDMLNEGWDVLNLFDIVRLYNTRDGKAGKPGKTTMQEAQLIGRGARYMPFDTPDGNLPRDRRKFDSDHGNPLRMLETLHYHSVNNPSYIAELRTAMVRTGILPEKTVTQSLRLKPSFKKTACYRKGYVFVNRREAFRVNEELHSLGGAILARTFKVNLASGHMMVGSLLDGNTSPLDGNINDMTGSYRTVKLCDMGRNVIRAAINRLERFSFEKLQFVYPTLTSIREFIDSPNYLGGISVDISRDWTSGGELTQREKLQVCTEVLRQMEPMMAKGGTEYKGSLTFKPLPVHDLFKDRELKITVREDGDSEFGVSMREARRNELRMDLSEKEWHAYNDCFGTSEEKFFIKYMDSVYDRLREKYQDIYLLRNEKAFRLFSFKEGNAFEPDYVLLLKRPAAAENCYDYIQVFIEPKGAQLRLQDKWKADFLRKIRAEADVRFSTENAAFNVWGVPFFTESYRKEFDKAFREELGI